MGQYFTNDPLVASRERIISFDIFDRHIELISDNGVFSKNKLDEGTFVLLKQIVPLHLKGNILDLGCGVGPIGLTIALTSPNCNVTLADVNERAVRLCQTNANLLGLSQKVTILQSDIFEKIEGPFDSIVINPPVRAGKKVTYSMYEGSLQRLIDGGSLFIVIRKNQGGISASRYIETLFGNVTLIKREKGYYVYKSIKGKINN